MLTFQAAKLAVQVLNALHGLMLFYNRDYTELNLDALFGLRVIQGHLQILSGNLKHESLPLELLEDIRNLSESAGRLANKALPHVFNDDQEYFKKFKYFVHKPYNVLSEQHLLTDPKTLWPLGLKETEEDITESESDKCIGQLLAAAEQRDEAIAKGESIPADSFCAITKDCLNTMLNVRGLDNYALTHQILYTSVSQLTGCTKVLDEYVRELKRFRRDGIEAWRLEWCSNLLHQMHGNPLTATGKQRPFSQFGALEKDLFMEQIFTCGQFGFVEFVRREWLDHVLSWQDPSGCWKADPEKDYDKSADASIGRTEFKKRRSKRSAPGSRKLLVEKIASNNCAGHTSAVASGALLTFFRFLLDPGPKEWSHLRVDLQRGAFIRGEVPPVFRTMNIDTWKLAPDSRVDVVEEFVKPPEEALRDWTMFFSLSLILLFLYVFYRLTCRRKKGPQIYPFSFKKL